MINIIAYCRRLTLPPNNGPITDIQFMNPNASDFPRNRWTLLAMVSIAFVINFLDRQVLSVLAPTIRHELASGTRPSTA